MNRERIFCVHAEQVKPDANWYVLYNRNPIQNHFDSMQKCTNNTEN